MVQSTRDATAILQWEASRWPSVRLLAYACDTLDSWGVRRFPVHCRPLGFDVVSLGEWSLLRAMLDANLHPGVHLNPHGLVDRLEDASSVVEWYRRYEVQGLVERTGSEEETGTTAVAMFEVAMDSVPGASPGERMQGYEHPDVRGPVSLKYNGDPDPRERCR